MTIINLDFRKSINNVPTTPIDGVFVAYLESDIHLADRILPARQPIPANVTNGEGTIDLFPSQTYGVFYRGFLQSADKKKIWTGLFQVPESGTAVELSQLATLTPIDADNFDQSVQAIVDALVIDPEFATLLASIVGTGGGSGAVQRRDILTPPGSTFNLSAVPTLPHLSGLFVNGQRQAYGTDYTINGAVLQWLGYSLRSGWRVEIFYQ